MKTVTTKIYQFKELSKAARKTAIKEMNDINTSHDWWDMTYDDAKEIGLEITGFDLNSRMEITGKLTDSAKDVADAIIENHGPNCETYKTATEYLKKCQPVRVTGKLIGTKEAEENSDEEIEELAIHFERHLLNNYWKMLYEEYNYLQTDKAIQETIEAKEYEFYKDGTQYTRRSKAT
jgi:hypothetical protein